MKTMNLVKRLSFCMLILAGVIPTMLTFTDVSAAQTTVSCRPLPFEPPFRQSFLQEAWQWLDEDTVTFGIRNNGNVFPQPSNLYRYDVGVGEIMQVAASEMQAVMPPRVAELLQREPMLTLETISIAPTQDRVIYSRLQDEDTHELWLLNLETGLRTRLDFTFDGGAPVTTENFLWSADGNTIIVQSVGNSPERLTQVVFLRDEGVSVQALGSHPSLAEYQISLYPFVVISMNEAGTWINIEHYQFPATWMLNLETGELQMTTFTANVSERMFWEDEGNFIHIDLELGLIRYALETGTIEQLAPKEAFGAEGAYGVFSPTGRYLVRSYRATLPLDPNPSDAFEICEITYE